MPAFVVIPQEAGLSFIPQDLIERNDFEAIRVCIREYIFPARFSEAVRSALPGVQFFAVRSSAADEDGGDFSFAGQFESHLFVTAETLEENIRKVWLSAYSERVRQYRASNKISSKHGIAVIIQTMIDAEVAGVAFGANPASGDRKEKVISAVYGLGEGLVSGELNADNFFVKDEKVKTEVTEKTEQLVWDREKGSGTKKIGVPAEKKNTPSLSEMQAQEISAALDKLKKAYGRPQDIEFAYQNNTLFLLQTRPITSLQRLPDADGQYVTWDNSNIIESYPGLTSPLTFSFILRMYEGAYLQFSELMGISEADRKANGNTYANMLGLLNGRVYYNLRSWYKLLSLLPGYSLNAGFMEKMMGVKERFELDDYTPRTKFKERLRVLKMIRIMLQNLRRLPRMRDDFQQGFDETMTRFSKIDLDRQDAWTLMKLYMEFEEIMLKRWKAPLVNDFFAMIYYGTLQKLTVKYGLDEQGQLHNDLLCGARDIISTDPIRRCLEISALVNADAEAKALFERHDEQHIWKELQRGHFPAILEKVNEYLRLWGDRCVGELKLETVTYKQNPPAFVKIIRSYVKQGVSAAHGDHDLELRRKAEARVGSVLSGRPLKKWLYNYVLRKSRDLVSNRENLRFARTRGFGMVRELFCAIGRNFHSENLVESPRDIFFLKKEEVFDFIQGTSPTRDLKSLIALRKAEYARFEKEPTAERIPTRGIVYLGNDFRTGTQTISLEGDLKGIGCCPGRVKARVRVVHDPNEISDLNGDILVTSSTDPGWVTLFPTASAILVERGSLLSHSAIVSREMGKPCVVGVTGLLQRLKSGDLVEMDGSSGEIKILEQ